MQRLQIEESSSLCSLPRQKEQGACSLTVEIKVDARCRSWKNYPSPSRDWLTGDRVIALGVFVGGCKAKSPRLGLFFSILTVLHCAVR